MEKYDIDVKTFHKRSNCDFFGINHNIYGWPVLLTILDKYDDKEKYITEDDIIKSKDNNETKNIWEQIYFDGNNIYISSQCKEMIDQNTIVLDNSLVYNLDDLLLISALNINILYDNIDDIRINLESPWFLNFVRKNMPDFKSISAFEYIILNNDMEMLHLFMPEIIDKGIDPDIPRLCVHFNRLNMLKEIIKSSGDVYCYKNSEHLLNYIIYCENFQACELVIECGHNINEYSISRENPSYFDVPLTTALKTYYKKDYNNAESIKNIIKLLFIKNAILTYNDTKVNQPLDFIFYKYSVWIIKLLDTYYKGQFNAKNHINSLDEKIKKIYSTNAFVKNELKYYYNNIDNMDKYLMIRNILTNTKEEQKEMKITETKTIKYYHLGNNDGYVNYYPLYCYRKVDDSKCNHIYEFAISDTKNQLLPKNPHIMVFSQYSRRTPIHVALIKDNCYSFQKMMDTISDDNVFTIIKTITYEGSFAQNIVSNNSHKCLRYIIDRYYNKKNLQFDANICENIIIHLFNQKVKYLDTEINLWTWILCKGDVNTIELFKNYCNISIEQIIFIIQTMCPINITYILEYYNEQLLENIKNFTDSHNNNVLHLINKTKQKDENKISQSMKILCEKFNELINKKNNDGDSPLSLSNNHCISRILLEQGANINNINQKGNYIIHDLIENKENKKLSTKLIDLILRFDDSMLNKKNKMGMTPFMLSIIHQKNDIGIHLANRGAILDTVDMKGNTCLHHMIFAHNIENINLINVTDKENCFGLTPLEYITATMSQYINNIKNKPFSHAHTDGDIIKDLEMYNKVKHAPKEKISTKELNKIIIDIINYG